MILTLAMAVTLTALATLAAVVHAHGAHLAAREDQSAMARAATAAQNAHTALLERLLDRFESERATWTDERQLLLTRIADPGAGVAASLAYLPPPGEMDMEVER